MRLFTCVFNFLGIEEAAASLSRLNLSTGVGGGGSVSCEESAVRGVLNTSGNKASRVLDRTVCELQVTLSRLETEMSAMEEVGCGGFVRGVCQHL